MNLTINGLIIQIRKRTLFVYNFKYIKQQKFLCISVQLFVELEHFKKHLVYIIEKASTAIYTVSGWITWP